MSKAKFVYVIYIHSTPEKVWNALIDPEMTKDYWGLARNRSEWTPGSAWRHEDYEDAEKLLVTGSVLESDRPRRLVLSWAHPDDAGNAAKTSRVSFDIDPFVDSVRLTVTHEELEPDSEMLHGISAGWPAVLSSMKTLLETGAAMPMTQRRWGRDAPTSWSVKMLGQDKPKFVYVTFIRTTPEKLWSALTSPDFTRQYWFGMHHETDWKPGSSWRMLFADGQVADAGEILEADPPKLLVIKWRNEFKPELKSEGYSRCAIEIEPIADAVKLTITHVMDHDESKFIEAVSGGWPLILSNLKSLLETGDVVLKGRHSPHKHAETEIQIKARGES